MTKINYYQVNQILDNDIKKIKQSFKEIVTEVLDKTYYDFCRDICEYYHKNCNENNDFKECENEDFHLYIHGNDVIEVNKSQLMTELENRLDFNPNRNMYYYDEPLKSVYGYNIIVPNSKQQYKFIRDLWKQSLYNLMRDYETYNGY